VVVVHDLERVESRVDSGLEEDGGVLQDGVGLEDAAAG